MCKRESLRKVKKLKLTLNDILYMKFNGRERKIKYHKRRLLPSHYVWWWWIVENSGRQNVTLKSKLDIHLEDPIFIVAKEVKFDILDYWRKNANKYKTLWVMVKDVLSIWMDSITFEYAFSTNERLISDHKNNLKSETIEALICSWDSLRLCTIENQNA